MMRHYPCLRTTGNPSLKSSSNPLLNFIQIANKKNSIKKKSQSQDFRYDVKIAVIKQTDEKDDHPLEYNNQVTLSKNSIDIYETGVIKKQITYLDFLFMDGVVLFDNLDYFNKVQNEIYNDLMTQLKPKIIRYAEKHGRESFNKFCFFAFRSKYQDEKIKQLGKIYTAVIFCLNKDTTDEVLAKFTENFMRFYTDKIVEEKNLMKIQNYRLKQNIQIQYYDPMEKINSENPKLPNFYTSFAKEGLVLNEDPHYDPLRVKYSFRFDQVVECSGGEASTLKAIINPEISSLFRPDYCCVSYLVDWQQKGVKNMFCSIYQKEWKCKADIKIFQSTLYQFCIMNQIEKLNKVLIESNNNIRQSKLYFLERASIITVIREILYTDIEMYMDQSSYLYYLVSKEKKRAKYDLYDALRSFDLDTNSNKGISNKKGCVFGNEEFLLDESKSEFIVINEEKMVIDDFEHVNRREQKSLYDNAAMSIQILKEMKISFCKELWRMKVEDEDIEIKSRRNKTTIINRETLIIRRIKRIRNIAIYIINIIKRQIGNRKLTDREIIIITNIIIRHSELFIYVIRFRIQITIEIINILIINEEHGISIIWKLVREKMFKLRYEDDPTHGNSTLGCNITKEYIPPGPYPPPGPFPDDDNLTLTDDLTGYIDEADYMKIPGIPVDYINREKTPNSTITIPRTIPKVGKKDNPPGNDTPKNITDNDVPIIGDEEPTPLFPMNPNPGVEDDPDGNRDLIPPVPPKPDCIGPDCKNKTQIIDCSGPDCLIPFPMPPEPLPIPCNKTVKCTEGVDCPCIKGVNCPCTPGVDCPPNPPPNPPENCTGSNCPPPNPPPNPPENCTGSNCPPPNPPPNPPENCTGSNCPPPNPPQNCTGSNCPPPNPPPNPPQNCNGSNCPPPNPPQNCTGSNCPPEDPPKNCTGSDCPPKCPGPNCNETKCNGTDCCQGEDCKCKDGKCGCTGDNCCKGDDCKCKDGKCGCTGPNCCQGQNCPNNNKDPKNNSTDLWIYSAQTIYNNDPLNRPKIEGLIIKSQMADPDGKKLLDLFGKVNDGTDVDGNSSMDNTNQNNINSNNQATNNNQGQNVNNNSQPNTNQGGVNNPPADNMNANVNPNIPNQNPAKRLKRLR